MITWVERDIAGYRTLTWPYDGPEGIIKAIQENCAQFGSEILRVEYQPNVGVTVTFKGEKRRII